MGKDVDMDPGMDIETGMDMDTGRDMDTGIDIDTEMGMGMDNFFGAPQTTTYKKIYVNNGSNLVLTCSPQSPNDHVNFKNNFFYQLIEIMLNCRLNGFMYRMIQMHTFPLLHQKMEVLNF